MDSQADYFIKSSFLAYETYRAAFESFNLDKNVNKTGIITQSLNTPWPSQMGHLWDYFTEQTPAYFAVKLANQRVHI